MTELDEALAHARVGGVTLGFVPTMGALHAGHRALIAQAAKDCAAVAVSIFVNPLQFGPTEDFSRYPRDEAGDLAMLRDAGVQVAWLPALEDMYPPDAATRVEVGGPAEGWEGAARPGHFRGVATVVARLFSLVRAEQAYFGEKDWQQLQVVRRMTADLGLPVRVMAVPTVRDTDGLALSSRNRYLTDDERARAPLLYSLLRRTRQRLADGTDCAQALADASAALTAAGFVPDYLALVDGPSLRPLMTLAPQARLIAAARLGTVRLLDNIAAG